MQYSCGEMDDYSFNSPYGPLYLLRAEGLRILHGAADEAVVWLFPAVRQLEQLLMEYLMQESPRRDSCNISRISSLHMLAAVCLLALASHERHRETMQKAISNENACSCLLGSVSEVHASFICNVHTTTCRGL